MKFLLDDGDQHVSRHGAPDLRLDGVLAVAQELLDSQMLLDPFEEQFDLPAVLVECCDSQRGQDKIVGQEYERLATLDIFESNASQVLRVMLGGVKPVEQYRLIANNSGRSIDGCRINSASIHIGFGARHEESARLMQGIKTCEIQVAAIHDIERTSFDWHEVQHVDFVHLAVADVDKRWDCAPQVQQGVEFDRTLGTAKGCPVEQTQTQIDRGCVQCVDGVLQVESDQVRVAVEFARATNQQCSDVRPNAPIARFVRIGQCRAMNAVTQPHRIEFVRVGAKSHLDVAQTLAPRQLSKSHHAKLFRASHATNACVAAVAIDDTTKARPRHKLHNLRKKRLADIHERSPRG